MSFRRYGIGLLLHVGSIALIGSCTIASSHVEPSPTSLENRPLIQSPQGPSLSTPSSTSPSTTAVARTPTLHAAISPTQLPTALTTLMPSQKEDLLDRLFADNWECMLPCFWGLTPGISEHQSAVQLLSSFGNFLENPIFPGLGQIAFNTDRNELFPDALISITIWFEEDRIDRMEISTDGAQPPEYSLGAILEDYGEPDQVLVLTYASYMGSPPPFYLILFYPRQSFAVQYTDAQGETRLTDTTISACLSDGPNIKVWPRDRQVSLSQLSSMFPQNDVISTGKLLTLESASGISIDQFYQQYHGGQRPPCLETPRRLWPHP